MAQFIEIRNAKTDELVGVRTNLNDAKFAGAFSCDTDGFILTIMQIDVNSDTISRLLEGRGGYASKSTQREYTVTQEGCILEVKTV